MFVELPVSTKILVIMQLEMLMEVTKGELLGFSHLRFLE